MYLLLNRQRKLPHYDGWQQGHKDVGVFLEDNLMVDL